MDNDKLHPEETVQQFETKFQNWLNEREVDLRDNPEVELLFRRDFATLRAHELRREISTEECDRLDRPKSMLDDRSDSEEEGEIREESTSSPASSVPECSSRAQVTEKKTLTEPQFQRFHSHDDLLKMRTMSAREFLKVFGHYGPNCYMTPSGRILPIAIVLRPDENALYFKKWLQQKGMALDMLQCNLEEECHYTKYYAYSRYHHSKWKNKLRDRSSTRSPSGATSWRGESWRKRRTSIDRERYDSRFEDNDESKFYGLSRKGKQRYSCDLNRRRGTCRETFNSEVAELTTPTITFEEYRGADLVNTTGDKVVMPYSSSAVLTRGRN